jgi:hypothetical protein
MTHHSYPVEQPAQTEGKLIRWAPYYDLAVKIITPGQAHHLRKMTVDHALIKPGDSVLDVVWYGCCDSHGKDSSREGWSRVRN